MIRFWFWVLEIQTFTDRPHSTTSKKILGEVFSFVWQKNDLKMAEVFYLDFILNTSKKLGSGSRLM
jgi:hypothetical protein